MKFIIILALALLATTAIFSQQQTRAVSVSHVFDGDTIKLSTGQAIRLVGINAPEKGEPLYEESSEKLSDLVLGKEIEMESDSVNRDRYNRLLRYLFVNGVNVNIELVRNGYARAYLLQNNMKYSGEIQEAENYAKKNNLGMWSKE